MLDHDPLPNFYTADSAFPAKPPKAARAGISTVRDRAEAIEIPDSRFAASGNAD
jgi:hypothetical protein